MYSEKKNVSVKVCPPKNPKWTSWNQIRVLSVKRLATTLLRHGRPDG